MRRRELAPLSEKQKEVLKLIAKGDPYGNCNSTHDSGGRACTIQSLVKRGLVMPADDTLTAKGRAILPTLDSMPKRTSTAKRKAYDRERQRCSKIARLEYQLAKANE